MTIPSIEETMKRIILNDLDSIRKGTAGNIRDEHVIIANALSYLISELVIPKTPCADSSITTGESCKESQ